MTTINLLFSMAGPYLTDGETAAFAQVGQWVVLNERNNRLFVDAVGDESATEWAIATLTQMGRTPAIIGGWHVNGSPVDGLPLDEAAWLDVAPDVWDRTNPENPVVTRPLAFDDVHRWDGWADKEVTGG